MDRRTLLRRALVAGSVGLAGCAGGGPGDGSPTPSQAVDGTQTPSPTGDSGPSPTGTRQPTGTDRQAGTDTETRRGTDTPTGTEGETPTQASTTTEDRTTGGTATESPTPTSTPTPSIDQEVVVGPGGSLRFDPETFTVAAGDTVLWVWDSDNHNVSPDDGGQPGGADWPGDDDTTYAAGHEYAYTFDVPGEYSYHCDPHQSLGMTGSFTVEE